LPYPKHSLTQVQALLLILGGWEVPLGLESIAVPTAHDEKYATVAARRISSLMRFREKRKERCFDKKIRYNVRKEVAQKMKRRKGQFAGRVDFGDHACSSSACSSPANGQNHKFRGTMCYLSKLRYQLEAYTSNAPGASWSKVLMNACGLIWANKVSLWYSKKSSECPQNETAASCESLGMQMTKTQSVLPPEHKQATVRRDYEIMSQDRSRSKTYTHRQKKISRHFVTSVFVTQPTS
ncbi:hypothetical protein EJB05_04640, partial [Eragrostis curvula]